jgi:hypothetical protein
MPAMITLFAIPGQSEIIGAPQNKKARVVRANTKEKKHESYLSIFFASRAARIFL